LNAASDCEILKVSVTDTISAHRAAMTTVAHPPIKGYRTIRVPLAEPEYARFLSDRPYTKARLQELYEDYPELFPEAFLWGYALYGFTDSS
jgi:hypothetical protein